MARKTGTKILPIEWEDLDTLTLVRLKRAKLTSLDSYLASKEIGTIRRSAVRKPEVIDNAIRYFEITEEYELCQELLDAKNKSNGKKSKSKGNSKNAVQRSGPRPRRTHHTRTSQKKD